MSLLDIVYGEAVRANYKIFRLPATKKVTQGNMTQLKAKVVFDTALTDANGVSNKTVASHPQNVFIPANAVITRAYYVVNTAFTSASGNTGTIAITDQTAGDIKAAVAVSDATLVGAGANDTIVSGAATTHIINTAERQLTFTVAVAALTAGKLTLVVEYYIA